MKRQRKYTVVQDAGTTHLKMTRRLAAVLSGESRRGTIVLKGWK